MATVRRSPVRVVVGRAVGLIVLAIVLVAQTVLVAPYASAHDELAGSTPAADAILTTAPTSVTLSFEEAPLSAGLAVAVTGPQGGRVTAGSPAVSGTDVVTPLAPLSANGDYTVAWRVVAADGHPVTGTFRFRLTLTSASAEPSVTPSELLDVSRSPGPDLTPWMVGGSVLLLAVIVVIGLLARRRPS
jgi:methionine-rich copper-binding protein CopC